MNKYTFPIIAFFCAVAITTIMDFTGFTIFSAIPLLGITILFWLIQRQSKEEFGLTFGALKYYGLGLLYPVLVLGAVTFIAYVYGDFSLEGIDWIKKSKNILAGCIIGPLMLILTEEGFFRGWLWGAFKKAGMDESKTLFVTSGLFMLWHISAVTSGTEFGLPLTQVPVYLINVALLGLIWGLLRSLSGSVVVPAVSHAVWNAFAYEFFGYGEKFGALGITDTYLLGPEVGYLGILLNGIFFIWLWNKSKKISKREKVDS